MSVLGQAATSKDWQLNVLTDGHLSCKYQDISIAFERLQQYFSEQGIGPQDYLAFPCANSLPNALLLLYLLEKGYSFVLLPHYTDPSQAQGKVVSVPEFCRFTLTARAAAGDGDPIDLSRPEEFARVVEHESPSGNDLKANPNCPTLYLRTSGSTGNPKLVAHQRVKFLENARNCVQRLELGSADRIAIPVPIFHMYGLGAALLPSLTVGASIDLQQNANLLRFLQRERAFEPNVTFLTPAFCKVLLQGRRSPRAYKLTVMAGDRLEASAFAQYEERFGCAVSLYGSTEMGAIAASGPSTPQELRAETTGQPLPGVSLRGGPEDSVGELWCQHAYGFAGYVDDRGNRLGPDPQEPWFPTKDLGRLRANGYLEVIGRCDLSVNRDGLLVLFADVERALIALDGIDAAAVVAKGESQRGKGLVAYCVRTRNSEVTAAELREACFEKLPRRAVPDRLEIVPSLPLLPSGKVDRQQLIRMDD